MTSQGQRDVDVVVVCGNPKPQSRTLSAAIDVARRISNGERPATIIDLVELGPALLQWEDPQVTEAAAVVCAADVLVIASPTYKASFTGLLKLFLDQLPSDSLRGTIAVPVMMGGGREHSLVPELHLRPVLVELGASCPTRSIFFVAGAPTAPVIDAWVNSSELTALRRIVQS